MPIKFIYYRQTQRHCTCDDCFPDITGSRDSAPAILISTISEGSRVAVPATLLSIIQEKQSRFSRYFTFYRTGASRDAISVTSRPMIKEEALTLLLALDFLQYRRKQRRCSRNFTFNQTGQKQRRCSCDFTFYDA
ncbi:hypothetical protein chiPu_0020611 [Chiloscyllium punctatum]|uniref:Uncharacterized protein n=1 Tax=Chiloscyllium punctatum TaxID=137246 RepID=A0A401RHP5_CHIPU|nr:hypothetical protein [Chiloscyllium punctatum]